MIYQRMYSKETIGRFYLSPYIEYYIEDSKVSLYSFESGKAVQLKINNGKDLIKRLIEGIEQENLLKILTRLCNSKDAANKILILLIQNKIIE